MKRSIKEILLRVLILMVGLTIAHFGVTLFLLSDLGADPFNVLVQGVCRTAENAFHWGLSHGSIHRIICLLIILVLLIVDRSYVKIGTLLCMFCGGPIIDFFTFLLGSFLNEKSPIWIRFVMLAAGCVILAFGMTMVIKSDAGTGPNDLVALVISEKTKWRFGIVRICTDAAFVVAGFVLGGVFGVGTVVCAFLVGPVADVFLPRNEKWIKAFLQKALREKEMGKNG